MKTLKRKTLNIHKDKLLLSVIAISLSLYIASSLTFFASACGEIRNDVVRLHILANSDSKKDQEVKLKVRNALLEKNTLLLSESVTKENAYGYFTASKNILLNEAKKVLLENGFDYDVKITLENEYFETRQYENLIFPAGEYLSLKVVLGEGKGHNWWCVMFPPLCVPAAGDIKTDDEKTTEYLSPNEKEIISGGKKYIFKFKIVEIYEELKSKL